MIRGDYIGQKMAKWSTDETDETFPFHIFNSNF